jgi:hypothetical protein
VIILAESLKAWDSPGFEQTFSAEVRALDSTQLPLQQALSQSSYVFGNDFTVIILNTYETEHNIEVKTGIFYSGIIAGSCCADDPTPMDQQTEYCELQFVINKLSAETTIKFLQNQ